MKDIYQTKCPLCGGTGEIMSKVYPMKLRNKARKLYAEGKTLREVGKIIGVNHPQRVKSLIMSTLY